MVTSESNQGQSATATAPFERQTQIPPPSRETSAQRPQPQAEQGRALPVHDPFWSMSLVVGAQPLVRCGRWGHSCWPSLACRA